MGVFKKGINGPFSGKTGSIIGSKWKKIHYMKGLPRKLKSKRVASEDQLEQRERFKLLLSFFSPIHKFLNIGFKPFLNQMTSVNAAMNYNRDFIKYQENGEIALDFSRMQFSHGSLFTAGAESALLTTEGVKITWNTKTYGISGRPDDQAHILGFSDGRYLTPSQESLRQTGEAFIKTHIPGSPIHIWLFFSSADGKQLSKTVYIPVERDNLTEQSSK